MKTTKKRLLLGIAGVAMLCIGAVFTTLASTAEPQITDETMLANIEALSDNESGGIHIKHCWFAFIGYPTGVYYHSCSNSSPDPNNIFECGALVDRTPSLASSTYKCYTNY